MSSSQQKRLPVRASLPRRTTRNPLEDEEDPLSATASPSSTRVSSTVISPLAKSDLNPFDQVDANVNLLDEEQVDAIIPETQEKNLSFLLDAAIYHPLSQVEIPAPFRKHLPDPPPPRTPLLTILNQIDTLCASCDFIGAAHLSAICLTAGIIQATDYHSIFRLLAVRFSCLELIGQILLAAQEAKALEDLSSEFYYIIPEVEESEVATHGGVRPPLQHLMPFAFRVQAIRLQNIGFSDPRRGITALYDLGLEIREQLRSPYTQEREKEIWTERLVSLSMHVVNALVELGDLDCASRTLAQSEPKLSDSEAHNSWLMRMVLLLVRLGHMQKVLGYIDQYDGDLEEKSLLTSIVAFSDGKIDESIHLLKQASQGNAKYQTAIVARQNLAVAYVYTGRISEAKAILEELVGLGYSFPSLTINLATVYDLISDKSRDLKLQLVGRLAAAQPQTRAFSNADFKL